jgi:hypothetical protein
MQRTFASPIVSRRSFSAGLAMAIFLGEKSFAAAPAPSFVMWHNPGCGCCLEWGKRMEAAFGRKLPVIEAADLAAIKRARGVPADLQSCHTALVHGYVIEGHVPPADIQRLIRSRSSIIRGLAVPGMPAGSPGMDVGHNKREPYKVYAFDAKGRRSVVASHG